MEGLSSGFSGLCVEGLTCLVSEFGFPELSASFN